MKSKKITYRVFYYGLFFLAIVLFDYLNNDYDKEQNVRDLRIILLLVVAIVISGLVIWSNKKK